MFSALPLIFAFILHSLHPTLAASAANTANIHVADILAVNEILEIQINHTIADVNAVLALNKTIIAPVRKRDAGLLCRNHHRSDHKTRIKRKAPWLIKLCR